MRKQIIVYGLTEFTEKELIQYLREGIYENDNRFRYTQAKNADIIVVSFNGFAYGHMNIEKIEKPKELEKKEGWRKVYIVNSTEIYKNPVRLADYGITDIQFGKCISDSQFNRIIKISGTEKYYAVNKGAGFGSSKQNKIVEKTAIACITKKYSDNGWMVKSVESARCGYDLKCTKKEKEINIEVKGISGQIQSFVITANEIEQAKKNDKFVLCVVNNVGTKDIRVNSYTGREFINLFSLKGLSYFAELI